jgi:hypothetical protein
MADAPEVKQLTPEEQEAIQLQNEMKWYELEEMRVRAEERRAKREQQAQMAERNARDTAAQKAKDDVLQLTCNHLKGGTDYASMQKQGTDGGNYSVIKHRHAFGNWDVLCTRCLALWKPGDTVENHPTKISFEQAFHFPTDNVPSQSVTFGIAMDTRALQEQAALAAAKK